MNSMVYGFIIRLNRHQVQNKIITRNFRYVHMVLFTRRESSSESTIHGLFGGLCVSRINDFVIYFQPYLKNEVEYPHFFGIFGKFTKYRFKWVQISQHLYKNNLLMTTYIWERHFFSKHTPRICPVKPYCEFHDSVIFVLSASLLSDLVLFMIDAVIKR